MKRQLNFWSKKFGVSDSELINVSLSIDNTQFTVVFRRPGSVKSITQVVVNVNSEESFNLKYAFESSGCQVFQDEMDERIYFANIARQRESAKRTANFAVLVGWSVMLYIICMLTGFYLLNLSILLTLCFSFLISILFGWLFKKKIFKEPIHPLEKRFAIKQKILNETKGNE